MRRVRATACLAGLLLLFAAGALPAAEAHVTALRRRDTVHLKDGSKLEGVILMAGPRAVVLVTDFGERLETVVPRATIDRIERARPAADPDAGAKPDADAPTAGDELGHYRAEPREGTLTLVEMTDGAGGTLREEKRETPDVSVDPDGWDLVPDETLDALDAPEETPIRKKKTQRRGLPPIFRPRTSVFEEKKREDEDERAAREVTRKELFGQDEDEEADPGEEW